MADHLPVDQIVGSQDWSPGAEVHVRRREIIGVVHAEDVVIGEVFVYHGDLRSCLLAPRMLRSTK